MNNDLDSQTTMPLACEHQACMEAVGAARFLPIRDDGEARGVAALPAQ